MRIHDLSPDQIERATLSVFPSGLTDQFVFIAATLHDTISVFDRLSGKPNAMPPFEACSDKHRDMMVKSVMKIWESDEHPRDSHNRWIRKVGEMAKEAHPDTAKPWHELSEEMQLRAMMHVSIARALFRLLITNPIVEEAARQMGGALSANDSGTRQ